MFSAFEVNLKRREFHEGKSRRKEKDFPLGCLKTLFPMAGVESQGGRLRGALLLFLHRVLGSQDPREGLQVGLGPMGAVEMTPFHVSSRPRESQRGHADKVSRLRSRDLVGG